MLSVNFHHHVDFLFLYANGTIMINSQYHVFKPRET
jgi:hypothetical protein